jgi:polyvinyl alcohol dehydrogenase (cytochrome)
MSDAILALSLADGSIKWVQQATAQDAWNAACTMPDGVNCPPNHGPDYDFGAPPILSTDGNFVLAGQKSGMVFALDPDDKGKIIWQAKVGRGGIMGGIHWGMAANASTLFVPINDRDAWPADKDKPAFSGLHAIDIKTGNYKWSKIIDDRCGNVDYVCGPGLSAAISGANDLILGASLDGTLQAFDIKTGNVLWEYNTNKPFTAVNGVAANGGTVDSGGPVIIEKQVFLNSGYAKFGEKAGNVLLCFEID